MKINLNLLVLSCLFIPAVSQAAEKWPACAPFLGFSASEIGVAAYEVDPSTWPRGQWAYLQIGRTSQHVKTVSKVEFEERFPGVLNAGNRAPGDCQELLAPAKTGAPVEIEGQQDCVVPKVFCEGTEITVRVSSTVANLPCPARLFSAATILGDQLWVGIAPLDPFRREYPGAGLLIQALDGSVIARLTPKDIGGKQVCAIRRDPYTNSVWATTESGLVELSSLGKIKRVLQIRSLVRPNLKTKKPR